MILKPYSNYKDSGVEWLGQVPEHWDIAPIKHVGWLKGGSGFPHEEQNVEGEELDFHKVNALGKSEYYLLPSDNTISIETAKKLGAFIFPFNAIVFAKVGAALLLARIRRIRKPACIDNNMMGLIVDKKYNISFVTYSMNLVLFDLIANPGTVPSLNEEQIGNFNLAIPNLKEQTAIAAYLDQETARIDELIAHKTRFIELLKEKRSALITHAVTKGLNPNAKMKDSGVEWLGQVPEHWEVMAIKHIVETPITDGPHETPDFIDYGVPFVSAEAVSSGYIDFNKIRGYISEEDDERYSKKYRPRRNDIFMIKSGATTGITAIVDTDIKFNIWSPLAVIRCGKISNPKFVLNFMRSKSYQEAIKLNWSFGTQQNIGMGVIGDIAITVPTIQEQTTIASYLDQETARIDELVQLTEQSINLIKERRSALITAAVTGKIDVREQDTVGV